MKITKEIITKEVLSQKYYETFVNVFDKHIAFISSSDMPRYGMSFFVKYFNKDITDISADLILPYFGENGDQNFIGDIRKIGREKKQKFILYKPKNNNNIFLLDLTQHNRTTVDTDLGEFDVNKLLHYFSLMLEKNVIFAEASNRNLYSPLMFHAHLQSNPQLKIQYPDVTKHFIMRKFIEVS